MAPLKTLGLASLTPDVLEFFEQNDINAVEDFMIEDLDELAGLEDPKIQEAIAELSGYLEQCHNRWESGTDMLERLENVEFLSTGFESLDSLLQGGLREGTITELVGASSSGKTQCCMQAAAVVAYQYRSAVAYVDTSNSFSPERVLQIVSAMKGAMKNTEEQMDDLKEVMMRIFCYKVYDVHSMLDVLHKIRDSITNPDQRLHDCARLRLVIVDCPASVISPVLGGNNVQGMAIFPRLLQEFMFVLDITVRNRLISQICMDAGHALMMSVGQILKRLAIEDNAAVLITNNTVAAEDEHLKPALGESWKSVPHIGLMLDKEHESSSCTATVLKHTSMACNTHVSFSFDRG